MRSEPHKIKTVKNLYITSQLERNINLREVGLNTFNITSNQVTYDMVSHGTSAKSQEQESGSLVGDETYAGSRNFEDLVLAVNQILGQKHVCPTHNLQGSLKLVTTTMLKPGNIVLSNSTYPKLLVENEKGILKQLPTSKEEIYTGDINISELESVLSEEQNISYIYIDSYADGYRPVSFAQIEKIFSIAESNNKKLVLNVSNIVELALLYKKENSKFENSSLKEIVFNIGQIAHVIVLDAGQDPRCNTGGLIAANEYDTYEKYMNEVVVYEGLHTYGGMAGRTMELFKRGVLEMVYEPQANWISTQVQLLSDNLSDVPHFKGADGIYIMAEEFLPHV